MAGCANGDVEKKRPASVFKATIVTLVPVVEEDDKLDDEDQLLTIIQFDDDGDAIMTDAWELDEISTVPVDEEALISGADLLDDDVVPPTPTSVGGHTAVPAMGVSFASAVPDSVQMAISALVPATLPEPTVTTVASAMTTGRPGPAGPIVAAVPTTPTAVSVPSALSMAVPFAMLAVPPDDSVHLVVSPIRIYPSEVIRSPPHGGASTGRVSGPPILRRSARLAAKNAMRNSMGTIFINGRRRSARLASRAL
jgi:hypothetical protein